MTIPSSSKFMEIRTTPHAGRSYHSTVDLPENSCLMDISTPYAYTIYKQFRNEVCSECFRYDGGRRSFLTCREYSESAGLSFCNDQCRDQWLIREGADAVRLLARVESARQKGKQKVKGDALPRTSGTAEDIEREWEKVRRLEKSAKDVRKWRRIALDDFQADAARYVVLALHHLFQELSSVGHVSDLGGSCWRTFVSLQSSETIRIKQFPELLDDHISIYQVLRGLFTSDKDLARQIYDGRQPEPEELLFSDVITVENVRRILAVDAGNSFGIWERPLIDNSELLGFAVYPVPSFFNHDCSPNVQSSGHGRKLRFLTTRAVTSGEALCISYGHVESLPMKERKKVLLEGWFFDCVCRKCVSESGHAE
ncbi:SET domain-containing protein [Cristinia sonorae]|uniref:SET domain-containing protein n=1 Tax=Cristinia sonorae TaxID=1940300 RepID=A0A8K0UIC8_9AGAR|nr:SET domain-containing protein [Cristinia sonorae]